MELKKATGDRLEDGICQSVNHLAVTLEDIDIHELFFVVQRGKQVAFFEYHGDQDNLVFDRIPNMAGCVSLTTNYPINKVPQIVMPQHLIPRDLETIYPVHNKRLKSSLTNQIKNYARQMAKDYTIPCVFDLNKHKAQINFLFHHMLTREARSSC